MKDKKLFKTTDNSFELPYFMVVPKKHTKNVFLSKPKHIGDQFVLVYVGEFEGHLAFKLMLLNEKKKAKE